MTAQEYYEQGNACRRQADWQGAINNYLKAIEIDPESPAVEAKQMLEDILNYYHKDSYNPKNIKIMAKVKGAVVVDTDRCKGCALCVNACPQGVIVLANRVNVHGYPYVEPTQIDKCTGCTSCAIVCPDACITVYRKKMEG